MISDHFQPNCLPLLIGSLPVRDHSEAAEIVFQHTPEIPIWVQLPYFKEEGMIPQCLPGFPGYGMDVHRCDIESEGDRFEQEVLSFYEEYMAVDSGELDIESSRFAMKRDVAKGFYRFLERLEAARGTFRAVKGQITGPFTFATGVKDASERAVFFDDQLRDIAVKLLAKKACWQVKQMAMFNKPVILFFDEPALAGFGTSEFISVSKDDVGTCFEEVIDAVHGAGGLAGIHVCANTEWPLILESSADIVSFDAYSYFDRFILYPEQIKKFLGAGKCIAWGIVPTLPVHIERETIDRLVAKWKEQAEQIKALGVPDSVIRKQTLITPSCGMGSLDLDHARKALELTRDVSKKIRETE